MHKLSNSSRGLAATITKAASKQTYYTIRLFVDHGHVDDAYRAYGYFRWVDDVLDAEAPFPLQGQCGDDTGSKSEKIAFINRQNTILESCYRGEIPDQLAVEELILAELVQNDTEKNSGLQAYLRNMMNVMMFDARRRGEIITQADMSDYSQMLATAVTEAMHFFIGHDNPTPYQESRYLAVTAAHITHMLRDTLEDVEVGYYNISREYLQTRRMSPKDVESRAYREWVCGRVQLARKYFKAGRVCLAHVRSIRCRLAGYAYIARFEWMLRTIERDNYCLRSEYPERKSLWTSLWMGWTTLASIIESPWIKAESVSCRYKQYQLKSYEK